MATARKCSRCCPDYRAAYCDKARNEDGRPIWICRNCGNEMVRRTVRRDSDAPTKSQSRVLERLLNNGRLRNPQMLRQEMIGRKVFFVLEETDVPWITKVRIVGTIGPRGSLKAEYDTVGFQKQITDPVHLI